MRIFKNQLKAIIFPIIILFAQFMNIPSMDFSVVGSRSVFVFLVHNNYWHKQKISIKRNRRIMKK